MAVAVFVRLPSFDTPEDALDHCVARGYSAPVLHDCASALVVGSAQMDAYVDAVTELAGEVELRARKLAR